MTNHGLLIVVHGQIDGASILPCKQAYLEPMTWLAWGAALAFLIVIPPCLYLVFALNPNPHDNVSLAESYGAVFVAMIMLGSPNDPKNVSTRIIFLWYVQVQF